MSFRAEWFKASVVKDSFGPLLNIESNVSIFFSAKIDKLYTYNTVENALPTNIVNFEQMGQDFSSDCYSLNLGREAKKKMIELLPLKVYPFSLSTLFKCHTPFIVGIVLRRLR